MSDTPEEPEDLPFEPTQEDLAQMRAIDLVSSAINSLEDATTYVLQSALRTNAALEMRMNKLHSELRSLRAELRVLGGDYG